MGPEKTEPSKAVAFSFGASTAAAAAPTPASSGFTKASADVLSKRKIIRTRRPQQSSTPSAPSGGGVFGGISLVPASGASTVPLKPAAPSKPAFVLPSSTPASSFSMSSSSSSKSMSTSSSKPVSEEEKELNTKFVDFLRNLPDRYFFDMACVQFINRLNIIRKKNQSIVSSNDAPSSSTSSTPAPAPAAAKAAAFSFGSTTTATEKTEPSEAVAFSFGASTTAAAPTPASSGFSFGAASSAVVPGANVKGALTPVAPDGEPSNEPQEQEPTAPMENADAKDWDEVYTTKVKAYRFHPETNDWTRFANGAQIRLQKNKSTGKPRMVIRDLAGKVLLNVGISSDMTFSKMIDKKNKKVAKIPFKGINDEEKGVESFMLVCRMEALDDLHSNLESMTK